MSNRNIKGLVGGIQKFSTEDGPGIRTTVFLKGCPLNCRWCHNPELIEPGIQVMCCPSNCIGCGACVQVCPKEAVSLSGGAVRIDRDACDRYLKCVEVCWSKALSAIGRWMSAEEVMAQVLQDRDFYLHTDGGMTISGGELLVQHEFAEALLDLAAAEGIGVALDTSGYGTREALIRLAGHRSCTHILFDLKHTDRDAHLEYTGADNQTILQNLRMLAADPSVNPKIIIRMPLIAGINDSEDDIQKACRLFADNGLKSVTLLPYHELGVSKCRNIGGEPVIFRAPSPKRIEEICEHFKSCGILTEALGE